MATILENEAAWSTTAATNANVDTGVNWAEGQDAASVNNSARGMMAARRKAALDQGGALVAGGTADALTVTTNQVLSAAHLVAGLFLSLRAIADNATTAPTFAPDGLTAAPIKRADGSALAIGSIKSGMMLQLYYNVGSSEWRAVNIAPVTVAATSSAAVASFSAHKNGTPQLFVTNVNTKVTFTTEAYDVGSYYDAANSKWTPPAGGVLLVAAVTMDATFTTVNNWYLFIYKNGAAFKATLLAFNMDTAPGSPQTTLECTAMDAASGTDYYEVYVYQNPGITPRMVGASIYTYFQGTMI